MIFRVLLASAFVLASVEARLEFCVCCKDQTGQPVTENCDIPAKSINEEELQTLINLCLEREGIYKRFAPDPHDLYWDRYYNRYYDDDYYKSNMKRVLPDINHIVYNRSKINYEIFPEKNCEASLTAWKDTLFWISGNSSWALTTTDGLLARKVVPLNGTEEPLYQIMTKQGPNYYKPYRSTPYSKNPSLLAFNGTYEVLLRIVPHLQSLHDIEYTSEKNILSTEQTNFGKICLVNNEVEPKDFVVHINVPSLRSIDLHGNYLPGSSLQVNDGNETFKLKIGWLSDYTVVKSVGFEDLYGYRFLDNDVLGLWGVVERNFTSKLTTILMESNPKNALLETELNVTGTKIERTIMRLSLENYKYTDSLVVDLSDRVAAGMLFTLAGIMIIGIILFVCKKCFCCCFRDRVTTGYQRIDETTTATNA
uniref:Uncharacterized protein n=1 Tax=Lutzomyia longipalpis TaxID=7200 RepID=A0A7G3B6R2_LUTLO